MMRLCGLQKLTLLDFPGKMACTVFTGGCDFRCPFCHNASLVLRPGEDGFVSESEFFTLLDKRKGLLDGVCVTGGEPLLQPDLPEFLRAVRARGYLVKLDTNGSFPDRLRALVDEGLADYVAMDLKNSRERYGETAGCAVDTDKIDESVRFLLSGAADYEFRTTVVRGLHRAEDFPAMGRWIRGAKRWFLQGFVDSGDLIGTGLSAFPPEEMRAFLLLAQKEVPSAELRGI